MSSSEITEPTLREAADVLQQQLIYNGEILDISLASLKSYTPGTQSLTFLDSSVHLSHALLRMLEKWSKSKGGETYVRQKTSKRRRKRTGGLFYFFFIIDIVFQSLSLKANRKKTAFRMLRRRKMRMMESFTRPCLPLRPLRAYGIPASWCSPNLIYFLKN